MSLNDILSKIEEIWTEMKKMVDAANASGEPMNAETQERYAKLDNELEKYQKLRDMNTRHLAKLAEHQSRGKPVRENPTDGYEARGQNAKPAKYEDDDGEDEFVHVDDKRMRSKEYRKAFRSFMKRPMGLQPDEVRILNETTNAEGGFLPAIEYYDKFVETRQLENFLRRISTVITLSSKSQQVTFEGALGAAAYEGESVATTDVTPVIDNLTLSAKKMVKLVKITEELLQDDRFDSSAWVASQIGRAMGQTELNAMLGGLANGPAGLKSIVTVGNSNLVTTAASGVCTPDEIIDTFYTVPQQYRENAVWILHDTFARAIRKLGIKTASIATANGSSITGIPYLWEPSFQAGQPDRLLGKPVYTTNVGLDAFAASNRKVALFGDFSYHFIADRDSLSVRFLDQAFIANGQYAWRGVARHDAGWTVKAAIAGLQIL